MRVMIIGKYPPIEGGVASSTYWHARALGRHGVDVDVVTNALNVGERYRERLDLDNEAECQQYSGDGVTVHSLDKDPPNHIPYSKGYVSRLANKALEVIDQHGCDVIFAFYLEPYGVAGLLAKELTCVPLVVQHAGSDIYRLLNSPDYSYILSNVLKRADGLFMAKSLEPLVTGLGIRKQHVLSSIDIVPDMDAFTPEGGKFDFVRFGLEDPGNVPVVTYIGKAEQDKCLIELCEALRGLKQDHRFLFVSQGTLEEQVYEIAKKDPKFDKRLLRLGFVPPWEIPNILRSTSLLAHLEYNFPVPIHSPLQPYEAIATQTPMLLSSEMFKKFSWKFPETAGLFNVIEDPTNIEALRTALEEVLSRPEKQAENTQAIRSELLSLVDWDGHVERIISLFGQVARHNGSISRLFH